MKKQFLILLILFTMVLTGCGVAGLEAEEEHLESLNLADWPTPEPAALAASPTPFPQVKLAAAVTPNPVVTEMAAEMASAGIEPNSAGNAVAQVNRGFYTPVATAFVIADNTSVYRQPGTAALGAAERGELVGVLGQNSEGDWLYVLTAGQLQGWLPRKALRITGTLEQAPILPADPLEVIAQAPASSVDAGASAGKPPVAPTDLKPITTAQVKSDGLNMRQGPGAAYSKLAVLSHADPVSVLAVNRSKDWALVETAAGQQGWVSLAFLTIQGDVTQAPVVVAAPPDKVAPAGQLASLSISQESSANSNEVNSIQARSAALQAELVSFNTGLAQANFLPAWGGLESVATGHITRDEVEVRPGPSLDYAAIDKLTDKSEPISVLALDQSGSWALVQSVSSHTGWVTLNDLAVEGSVTQAPQLFTAWVASNAVEVRSGPGIFHELTGQLAINSLVYVLGLDEGRSWALIQPIPGGSLGWTPIQFLKNVGQPWANVPQAPDIPAPGQVAAATLETVEPFTPARPLSESKIVFQRASGGDIMVINPDGSSLRRLTSGIDPVLSPDGQMVAFTRWEGETGSLWTIGVDGSNERLILGFIKQAKGPDWSSDGSKIVLNFQHGGRLEAKKDCVILDENSDPPRLPRNAYDAGVELSGEFKPKLCWKLPPDPFWGLRVVNVADGSFEDVDGGTYAFRPAWDPRQAWRIVSDGGRGLLEADLNRDYRHSLTEEINDGSPVFSPDGRYLAVTNGKEGGDAGYNLYRLYADGSGRVQLTETPLWVPVQPDAPKPWNNVAPAWSPDGSQIAFLTDRTGRWEIWVMNADGANQHPLFPEEVNTQLQLAYHFVDERVLSWR